MTSGKDSMLRDPREAHDKLAAFLTEIKETTRAPSGWADPTCLEPPSSVFVKPLNDN